MREIEMKRSHGSVRALALFAYISVLITSLSGCKDDKDGPSAHMGKVRLSLSADTTSLKKGIHSSVTKAVSDEFADFLTVDDYRILVVAGTDTAKQYDRFDKMPAEFELPEGTYSLIASKGNNLPAEYENPYFEGSTDFTVKEGMSSPLDVTCSLGNTRITLDCTDDFKAAYTDYSVGLKTAFTDSILEIKKDETRPAYLKVAKEGTDVSFAIKLKKVGKDEEQTYGGATPLKLQRRQNVRLILKTDGEALEGIGLDVYLDDSLISQVLDDTIPDFMWKPYDKPIIKGSNGLTEGKEYTMTAGEFEGDPKVEFAMPAGVGALYIKYWHDDEDPVIYNLADKSDVEDALKEAHFSWVSYLMSDASHGEPQTDKTLDDHVKSGIITLQDAFNSLASSAKENESYKYHFQIYGVDATGKAEETETLGFTVIVKPAGSPNIYQNIDFPEIVEGDIITEELTAGLIAGSGIQEAKLTISCSEPLLEKEYSLENESDKTELKNNYGIQVYKDTQAKIRIVYPKNFSTHLAAPANGAAIYTFKYYLKDKNDRIQELEKTMTVNAPVFTLLTGDGDAFARRIVLRASVTNGDKDKLNFEYKGNNIADWTVVSESNLQIEGNEVQTLLKDLTSQKEYTIRAVYTNSLGRRLSDEVSVMTEAELLFPNGTLVQELEDWSIQPDANGSTEEGYMGLIAGASGLVQKIPAPYRCWEIWQPWIGDDKLWNTLNIKTTSAGGLHDGLASAVSKDWTRYHANSGTIKTEGKTGNGALIRTVGWGDNNTATISGGLGTVDNRTPGELYLGIYNNVPQYGIPFTSRPTAFAFDYKYIRKNNDTFIAELVVVDDNGKEIAHAELKSSEAQPSDEWVTKKVEVPYVGEFKLHKAAKMYIRFVSGKSTSTDDLMIYPSASNLSNGEYIGSQLYIDNVTLIYE